MPTKAATAVLAALFLAGCAATTPAPRFSAVSPADEDGPEAITPPLAPTLAVEPEMQAGDVYTCRFHPEIQQGSPGSCPKCGERLVRRADTKQP